MFVVVCFFFLKQNTAYEVRISDCSSEVCSSDLRLHRRDGTGLGRARPHPGRLVVAAGLPSPPFAALAPPSGAGAGAVGPSRPDAEGQLRGARLVDSRGLSQN